MDALVLLVCDDAEAARGWVCTLKQQGIRANVAGSSAEAQSHWADNPPDLVIIDLCASPGSGATLCRGLRAELANPILVLVPETDGASVLEAYRAGADECIIKPLDPLILLAKVQAWLRRSWTVPAEALDGLQVAGLRLDPGRRRVERGDGSAVALTSLELRLLYVLMRHPYRVLHPDMLIERLWGYTGGDGHTLRNVVYRLRRKIEPDPSQPRYIETAPSGGYTFRPG